MKAKEKHMLLKTVQENNILPITSNCNMNCLFCSHKYNPDNIKVYRYGALSLEEVAELTEYLPEKGPIIIGESATKIIEGEPFTHPYIFSILTTIRKKWPQRKIKITTNGSLLTEKNIKKLSQLGNVKLNISINCSTPQERTTLMSDKNPQTVFTALEFLDKYNISYEGSIVALPHIMGWESIAGTVSLLAKYKTQTVRIFLPGFTRKTPSRYHFTSALYSRLAKFTEKLNKEYDLPLILEPPILDDFIVRIIGVINNTVAAETSIKKGDIITEINGNQPLTRVEAFNKLDNCSFADLTIRRNKKLFTYQLRKSKYEKTGIVLNYDLNPVTIERIKNIIKQTEAENIVIITSLLAYKLIKKMVAVITKDIDNKNIIVRAVKNNYFGGSIKSAGLLVNDDIINSLEKLDLTLKSQLIILPGIIYDIYGKDLTGSSYQQFKKLFSANIELIN